MAILSNFVWHGPGSSLTALAESAYWKKCDLCKKPTVTRETATCYRCKTGKTVPALPSKIINAPKDPIMFIMNGRPIHFSDMRKVHTVIDGKTTLELVNGETIIVNSDLFTFTFTEK